MSRNGILVYRRTKAEPIIAFVDGPEYFADFDEMQDALTAAYDECAALIGARVAPVGEAWRLARVLEPLVEGDLSSLQPDSRGIILGRVLAYDLGARIGDGVVLLIPRPVGDGTMEPVLERFVVSGVFEAGLQDHDSILALVNMRDAADILDLGDEATAVRYRALDVMAAPAITERLVQGMPGVTGTD